jgi:hypothetical protein
MVPQIKSIDRNTSDVTNTANVVSSNQPILRARSASPAKPGRGGCVWGERDRAVPTPRPPPSTSHRARNMADRAVEDARRDETLCDSATKASKEPTASEGDKEPMQRNERGAANKYCDGTNIKNGRSQRRQSVKRERAQAHRGNRDDETETGDVVTAGLPPPTKCHQGCKQKREAARHIGGLGPKAWRRYAHNGRGARSTTTARHPPRCKSTPHHIVLGRHPTEFDRALGSARGMSLSRLPAQR